MPQLLGTYYLSLLTESLLFAIAALSLDLVWGYTGIPDLGHALWFGTGALAVGMMTTNVDPTGLVLGDPRRPRRGTSPGSRSGWSSPAPSRSWSGCSSFSQGESDPFYIAIVTLALTVIAGHALHARRRSTRAATTASSASPTTGSRATTWYYICAGAARRRRGRRARARAQRLRARDAGDPRQRAPRALLRDERRGGQDRRLRARRDARGARAAACTRRSSASSRRRSSASCSRRRS